jgi:hypothetical protein
LGDKNFVEQIDERIRAEGDIEVRRAKSEIFRVTAPDIRCFWREGTGLSSSRASAEMGKAEVDVGVSGAGVG